MSVAVDPLLPLLAALAAGEDARASIVIEVARHVGEAVTRLPVDWFDREGPGAIPDLTERLVEACESARIARSPFSGRTVFEACRLGLVDGDTFRRHVLYGGRSLLRDLLRADRAAQLALQSGASTGVDTYLAVGEQLRHVARRIPGSPARWALARPAPVLAEVALIARLREQHAGRAVALPVLLEDALRVGGPRTQAGLTRVAHALLGADLPTVGRAPESARTRAALELADEEDIVEVRAEPVAPDCVTYRHAEWAVEVRHGVVTQIYGPSALTLRIHGQHLPLVRGVPAPLPAAELGPALDAVDVRGRRFSLRRD